MLRLDRTTPFGRAFGSRREQDRGGIVGRAPHQRPFRFAQPAQLVGESDPGPHVLEIGEGDVGREPLDQLFEMGLLDEGARGHDRPDVGGLAGGAHIHQAGGEVDHRGHAAGRHQGEDRHHRAVGIRHHHADRVARCGERHQLAAEDRGAEQQALIGEGPADRVLDRHMLLAVDRGRRDHRFDDGAVGRGGAEDQVRHDGVEQGAGRQAPPLAPQRRIDVEAERLAGW